MDGSKLTYVAKEGRRASTLELEFFRLLGMTEQINDRVWKAFCNWQPLLNREDSRRFCGGDANEMYYVLTNSLHIAQESLPLFLEYCLTKHGSLSIRIISDLKTS